MGEDRKVQKEREKIKESEGGRTRNVYQNNHDIREQKTRKRASTSIDLELATTTMKQWESNSSRRLIQSWSFLLNK